MPPSGTVLISLTGDMRIRFGEEVLPSTVFPDRQGRLMFAYLASRHRAVPRDELAEVLWPAGPPPRWKRDVSALASRLRTLLTTAGLAGSSVLVGSGDWYELRLPDTTNLDLDDAAVRLQEATEALADSDPAHALSAAQAAAAIARSPFLPGEDGEWIGGVRRELLRILLGALDLTTSAHERCEDLPSAVETAREVVELAPFSENAYAQLMRLQLHAGNRAEALQTYHRCRELLARELGVDPGPTVQAAYLDAVRSGLGSIEAGAVPGMTSIGEQAEGNLPRPVDRFVGRHAQLEAAALGSARLVTLTGVGGVGKSRLALEVATRLAAAYADGAWQCELSPVRAERDVHNAVAADLRVSQQPGQSPEDSVLGYLHAKRLLLVVDNCEHVLDSVRALVTKVLPGCPNVAVLATSRERLGIAGEQVIDVPPLPVPAVGADSLAAASSTASVELFCVRAGAARAGFALTPANAAVVADICRRLDGVPLAIELAAARVAPLGVTEIATRLTSVSGCSGAWPRHARPGARVCRAPSTGPTAASAPSSNRSSTGSPYSPADSPSRRPRRCAVMIGPIQPKSLTQYWPWLTSPWWWLTRRRRPADTGCWRPFGSMAEPD
jgi:DNA-binding SARP family transcriptional activator